MSSLISRPVIRLSSLYLALIGSLVFHVLCFFLLMQWSRAEYSRLLLPVPTNGTREKTLSVWLKELKPMVTAPTHLNVPTSVTSSDNLEQVEASNPGPHQTDVNFAPQLLGDIGGEVYGVVRSGSIIVRIDIDTDGRPSNLRLLYSDVAPAVVGQVERRILAAKYQAARRDGVAVSDSLNIMVTLEPSRTLGILGAP